MKKYFYVIFLLLTLMSCDKEMNYDYFIINQCNERINIYIEMNSLTNKGQNVVIPPYENKLIYHGTGINGLQDRLVEYFFLKINITKGDKISKMNYIDKNKWKFEPTSKSHANSYLTIYPEDFE